MQWITPTEDDLHNTLASSYVRMLKLAAVGRDNDNPLEIYLGEAIQEIRIAIASAGLPVSATESSVPPSLLRECAWLTLESAGARLSGLSLGAAQKSKIAEAKSTIKKVEKKQIAIELPDDPTYLKTLTSTSSKTMNVVSHRSNRINSQSLRTL